MLKSTTCITPQARLKAVWRSIATVDLAQVGSYVSMASLAIGDDSVVEELTETVGTRELVIVEFIADPRGQVRNLTRDSPLPQPPYTKNKPPAHDYHTKL